MAYPLRIRRLPGIALTVFLLCSPGHGGAEELGSAYARYQRAVADGRLEEALTHARRSLDLALQAPETDERRLGILTHNVGMLNVRLGRYADAITILGQALAIYRTVHGEWAEQTLIPLRALAKAQQAIQRWPEAERSYARAIEIIERSRGRDDVEIADIAVQLGLVADALGAHQRVQTYGRRAIDIYRKVRGENDLQIARIHLRLASNEITRGDLRTARDHLDAAVPIFESQLPSGDPRLAEVYTFLIDGYRQVGKPGKVRKYRKKLQATEQAAASR